MSIKKIIVMLAATLGLAVVAGCGQAAAPAAPPAGSARTSAAHNDADIAFTRGMLPHHRQAVEMSAMAAGRSRNPQVLALAGRIAAEQTSEIELMTAWLAGWGVAPDDAGMTGMMSGDEMGQFGQASGPAFDRMFLQLMTRHHAGAVDMAAVELSGGLDPAVRDLARRITDAQRAEIAEMQRLLTIV